MKRLMLVCAVLCSLAVTPVSRAQIAEAWYERMLAALGEVVATINDYLLTAGEAFKAQTKWISGYVEMNAKKMSASARLSMDASRQLAKLQDYLNDSLGVANYRIFAAGESLVPGSQSPSACMMAEQAEVFWQTWEAQRNADQIVDESLIDFTQAFIPETAPDSIIMMQEDRLWETVRNTENVNLAPEDNEVLPGSPEALYAMSAHIAAITRPKALISPPFNMNDTPEEKLKQVEFFASDEGRDQIIYNYSSAVLTDVMKRALLKHVDDGHGNSQALRRIADQAYANSKKRTLSDQTKTAAGVKMEQYNLLAKRMNYLLDEHEELMERRRILMVKVMRKLNGQWSEGMAQ